MTEIIKRFEATFFSFLRAFPLIGILIAGPGYFVYSLLWKGNTQIANGLLLTFVASTSLYVLPICYNVDKYFKNDKIESILEEMSELKDINELFNAYTDVSEPELFVDYKHSRMRDVRNEFNSLSQNKCTSPMSIQDGHYWTIPILENLKKGDYIKAATLLNISSGEWRCDLVPSWEFYIGANEEAAKKCKSVDRIFIASPDVFKSYKQEFGKSRFVDFMNKHMPKERNKTDLNGYFVNKDVFDIKYRDLQQEINEGFILIKQDNLKVAIIDKFSNNKDPREMYKVEINCNTEKIQKMEQAFDKIINEYNTNQTIRINLQ